MGEKLRELPNRLGRSTIARIALAVAFVGTGALGAVGLNVAEDQAETASGVVAEQCRNGQAAQVEAITPGACGTAATVEDQGAGKVTAAGPSGTAGAAGADGLAGAEGQAGAAGRDGRPGGLGAAGTNGRDGEVGPSGAMGAPGSDGANGSDGRDGISVQGPAGETGARGPVGADGPSGPPGPSGEPGAPGRDGSPAETQTFTTPAGLTYTCTRDGGTDTAPAYRCTT